MKVGSSWTKTGAHGRRVSYDGFVHLYETLASQAALHKRKSRYIINTINDTVLTAVGPCKRRRECGVVFAGVFVIGRCCKRLLGVRASAPASVILHLMFVWGVYLGIVREAVSLLMDVLLNLELGLIITGMWRIMHSDPGWVTHDSTSLRNLESKTYASIIIVEGESENIVESRRTRHCKSCNAYVKGYDHHCPAFESCIGQKNHGLFLVLLVGFIATEVSFAACCFQYIITPIKDNIGIETDLSRRLAISTMTFCLFQVTWQALFLAWHMYCICNNIKTDEWVNWTKYPEFRRDPQPLPGQFIVRFHNPYNKGVLGNLKEFLQS